MEKIDIKYEPVTLALWDGTSFHVPDHNAWGYTHDGGYQATGYWGDDHAQECCVTVVLERATVKYLVMHAKDDQDARSSA